MPLLTISLLIPIVLSIVSLFLNFLQFASNLVKSYYYIQSKRRQVLSAPHCSIMVSESQGRLLLIAISTLLGWLYTLAWSLSFWPQTLHNHKKRSVSGLSLDFCSLNFVGFLCYSIYNLSFILSRTVRQQYRDRHEGNENVVRWNDAGFAIHALFLTTAQVLQAIFYQKGRGQRVSLPAKGALVWITAITFGCLAACIARPEKVKWIDFVLLMGYVKLGITFVKYMVSL